MSRSIAAAVTALAIVILAGLAGTAPALAGEGLLYRLFHEDGVRVFDKRALDVGCRCTRERVANILRSFPRSEVEDLKVEGEVVLDLPEQQTRVLDLLNRDQTFLTVEDGGVQIGRAHV